MVYFILDTERWNICWKSTSKENLCWKVKLKVTMYGCVSIIIWFKAVKVFLLQGHGLNEILKSHIYHLILKILRARVCLYCYEKAWTETVKVRATNLIFAIS